MTSSPTIAALAAALAKAQAKMAGAKKDSTNPHFRSAYADLASVWDACRKELSENGLSVVQVPEMENGGDNFKIKVNTLLMHSSGEWISGDLVMIPVKDDPQGVGSAITYARRYALSAFVGIAPEDDDGNAAAKSPPVVDERPVQRGPSAADVACESIGNADSLDQLSAIWKDLPRSVQGEARVIKAKDARKTALTPAIPDDEIPY